MSRKDFWICIEVVVAAFMLGVMVGMCIQVLGVPVNACAEKVEAEGGYLSGMPCENPEQFERWYATYEQETSEESTRVLDEETTCGQTEMSETSAILEVESEPTVETDKERAITLYSFGEEMIEPYLQVMLYEALDRHGISYWYEIGLCEMWQESHGDIYAVNPRNGEDMGVMQYKVRYWDWSLGDIFSPEAQLELYATQMANRLNQGLSADECISRHITSDYCTEMDWQYVADVKQHLPNLRKVR